MGAQTSKGKAFAEDAEEAGWTTNYRKDGDKEIVVCMKTADCFLTMIWQSGRHDYVSSGLVVQGQARMIRNAATARRMLAGEGIQPVAKRSPIKKHSRPTADPIDGKKQTIDLVEDEAEAESWEDRLRRLRKGLPFKVSSPSEEIRKAVIGKEVTWINSRTKGEESACVLKDPNQKQLRIEYTRNKRRVLTFAAHGQGFRSVHIDAIITVR